MNEIVLPQNIVKGLENAGELPVLPAVVTEAMHLMNDTSVSFRKLAQVIELDPGFTASVLKVANSPLFRAGQRIVNLRQALTLLGAQEVYRICLILSVRAAFPVKPDHPGLDRESYWWHSAACGIAARRLVEFLRIPTAGEEFTAGILHDIGKLVLDHCFPEHYVEVIRHTFDEGTAMSEAEEAAFGGDHAVIGAWLCKYWNFPDALAHAVRYHHAPERAGTDALLPAITSIANVFARVTGNGFGGERTPVTVEDLPGWQVLSDKRGGMRDVDVAMLTFRLEEELKHSGKMFLIV